MGVVGLADAGMLFPAVTEGILFLPDPAGILFRPLLKGYCFQPDPAGILFPAVAEGILFPPDPAEILFPAVSEGILFPPDPAGMPFPADLAEPVTVGVADLADAGILFPPFLKGYCCRLILGSYCLQLTTLSRAPWV